MEGPFLGVDNTGTAYKFIVKNGISPFGAANGGKISPGEWQFVAGTYDGMTGTLYVDGVAAASDTFSPATASRPQGRRGSAPSVSNREVPPSIDQGTDLGATGSC